MSNLMQETVDWSLYPFRLFARTVDLVRPNHFRRCCAMTGAARGERRNHDPQGFRSTFHSGDTDLKGDDIKVVQSYIAFTKPDNERIYEVHTEIVNYCTTPEAYAGVVVGRFLRQHPDSDDADMRYLKPHIKVVERYPKEDDDDDDTTSTIATKNAIRTLAPNPC